MNILKYIILASAVFSLAIGQVVLAQADGFTVAQEVRNLTKQNFVWANSVQADPGDRLEFRVAITWQGTASTQNVLVRETFVQGLAYVPNTLRLDGVPLTGDVTQGNINIGAMETSQTKALTFEVIVTSAELLPAGITDFVNTATIFNADGGATSVSTVHVVRAGVPTNVPTGPLSMGQIGLALLFGAAFMGGGFLFLRSYIRREVLESPYETRIDRKLSTSIDRIRKQEKRG